VSAPSQDLQIGARLSRVRVIKWVANGVQPFSTPKLHSHAIFRLQHRATRFDAEWPNCYDPLVCSAVAVLTYIPPLIASHVIARLMHAALGLACPTSSVHRIQFQYRMNFMRAGVEHMCARISESDYNYDQFASQTAALALVDEGGGSAGARRSKV
jgi:hypothetical protein